MIKLEDMGSFHIGGKEIHVNNQQEERRHFTPGADPLIINPNGYHEVEQMYVQYFIPEREKGRYPLIFMHGGAMTGVAYENTPDGREGWVNYFIKKGWSIYNTDAVGRGRSGWNGYADSFKEAPIHLPKHDPFERFRIGDGKASYHKNPENMKVLPGSQFPIKSYDQFMKQLVPRWINNEKETVSAYLSLLEKTGPSIILAHSQGGLFAIEMALNHPSLVKGIILIEPTISVDIKHPDAFTNTPILLVYGDYIKPGNRWYKHMQNTLNSLKVLKKYNSKIDMIDLTKKGIFGNSHLPMLDLNSIAVANIIQEWLEKRQLYR